MTDQTIPAEKVRELADKYDQDSSGNPERLLVQAIADLRALLPTQQTTSGLFGRWAKHDAYGDVVVISDHPGDLGDVWVSHTDTGEPDGATCDHVPLADLTFPHQATKPEDVPENQPWLVDVNATHFKVEKATGFHYGDGVWLIVYEDGNGDIEWEDCYAKNITLVCPLVPERPVSDLQAKYDALDAKYQEAQERIKNLEQAAALQVVSTRDEYAALPNGSAVAEERGSVWEKFYANSWGKASWRGTRDDLDMSFRSRMVLRYGWGNEQPKPAWRIEYDDKNLRVGEYIIDKDGDTGTVKRAEGSGTIWSSGRSSTGSNYGPWIAFADKDAATPEAVEEATEARDKEAGE